MSGKILGIGLLLIGLFGGAALYYLQIYGFYTEIPDGPEANVQLRTRRSRSPIPTSKPSTPKARPSGFGRVFRRI